MTTAYRNPIISGFNPDPSCIRVGDDYYLTTSTFEYFPGLPIYHSKDLINWRLIGHVLTRVSQLDLGTIQPGGGIFAPTLRFHNGRFFVTVCSMQKHSPAIEGEELPGPRGFYVWTDDIRDSASWSDPVYYDVLGIDQDLFFDDDGKVYLSWATGMKDKPSDWHGSVPLAVFSVEIELESGRRLGPVKRMRYASVGNGVSEGPHVFKKDGVYYLLTAEGGTEVEHQEWVCRSTVGPQGPWEVGPEGSVNPIVYQGEHGDIRLSGHMDMFEGKDGHWWAVFLAVRPVYDDKDDDDEEQGKALLSPLGRETFLAPVHWDNGWPIVNEKRKIEINGVCLDRPPLARSDQSFSHDLTFTPGMNLAQSGWYHLRNPVAHEYDVDSTPGSLILYGGPYDIRLNAAVTMVLQKQTAFEGVWTTQVTFEPEFIGSEAGTAVWWSKWAFAAIAVRGVRNDVDGTIGKEIVFRYPDLTSNDFLESHVPCGQDGGGAVTFEIVCTPTRYDFYYVLGAGDDDDDGGKGGSRRRAKKIGHVTSSHLTRTRPFDSIFTGTHLALYATGSGTCSTLAPASFTHVKWTGQRAGGR